MKKLTIKELYRNSSEYFDKEIILEGWVRTVRASKNFGFIELNDGSFFKNILLKKYLTFLFLKKCRGKIPSCLKGRGGTFPPYICFYPNSAKYLIVLTIWLV